MQVLDATPREIKVFMFNTGVGVINRGIETFMRECFEGLRGRDGLHIELFFGAGNATSPDEHRLTCLPRTHPIAELLGRGIGRTGYVLEQLSAFPAFMRHIRAGRPDIVFLGDGRLNMRLYHWVAKSGSIPFRVLFSNGSPVAPPFPYAHHVQQVTPWLLAEALEAGEPPEKHSLVPYGIRVPPGAPENSHERVRQIRHRLELPLDTPIVLSVGWISRDHKRMDYTIREVAALPEPRPHLVMLGRMDDASPPVLELARQRLGPGNFTARSVPPGEVSDYYQCADVFVLSSLFEAFGRVYLEALITGLPSIVHDNPITRFVLAEEGIYADLSRSGRLARALSRTLVTPNSHQQRAKRRESVRQRFDWDVLAPQYMSMFRRCAGGSNRFQRSTVKFM